MGGEEGDSLVGWVGRETGGKGTSEERENSSARYVPVGLKGGVESPSSSSSPSSS